MTLEELFDLTITVLEKRLDGDCVVLWNTQRTTGHRPVLNIYQNHFSWVKRVNSFINTFVCQVCSRRYQRQGDLNRHNCTMAERRRRSFPGGAFQPQPTVFDKLSQFAKLSVSKACYPYRIAFDIEVILERQNLPPETNSLQYTARHSPLSVSYCFNTPGHTEQVCLVSSSVKEDLEVARLVSEFVDGLLECAAAAFHLRRLRYQTLLDKIDCEIE